VTDEARFREIYLTMAAPLQMEAADSAEYLRLFQEWQADGGKSDIREFLFRRAKTSPDLPLTFD
jgi:hypothetical protein